MPAKSEECEGVIAGSIPAIFEDVTYRPIFGIMRLCHVNPDTWEADVATIVHELMHALVRSRPKHDPLHLPQLIRSRVRVNGRDTVFRHDGWSVSARDVYLPERHMWPDADEHSACRSRAQPDVTLSACHSSDHRLETQSRAALGWGVQPSAPDCGARKY